MKSIYGRVNKQTLFNLFTIVSLLTWVSAGPIWAGEAISHISTEKLLRNIKESNSESTLRSLAKEYFTDTASKGQNEALLALIKRGDEMRSDKIMQALAKYTFRVKHQVDNTEMMEALLRADLSEAAVRRLNRYCLGRDDYRQIEHEQNRWDMRIIRAAAKFSNKKDRRKLFDKAKSLLEEKHFEELTAFLKPIIEPSPPKGFTLQKRFIGVGKTGEVALVKREKDGALFAWKLPVNDSPNHIHDMEKEAERAKMWREAGVTDIEVFFTEDHSSLLKSFVPGKTLRQIMESEPEFFNDPKDPRLTKLRDLLQESIRRKIFVNGVNYDNIKYSGQDWKVIDGEGATKMDSETEVYKAYRESLPRKWCRLDQASKRDAVEAFLETIKP